MSEAEEWCAESGWAQRQLEALLGTKVDPIRTTPDHKISVVDVARAITGHDANYAAQAVRNICERYPQMNDRIAYIQFPGQGQRETPVTDARGVAEVVMLLPGHHAARVRRQAAELLVRHLGGDVQVVDEVCALHAPTRHLAQSLSDIVEGHGQARALDEAMRGIQCMVDQVADRLACAVEQAARRIHPWEFSHATRSHSALLAVGVIVESDELTRLDSDEHVIKIVDFLKDRVTNEAWAKCGGKIKSVFAMELKKAKLEACSQDGIPPPIARMQGEYRIIYTEADNDLMVDVFTKCERRFQGIATRDTAYAKAHRKGSRIQDYFAASSQAGADQRPQPLGSGAAATEGARTETPTIQNYFTRFSARAQWAKTYANVTSTWELED